MISTPAAKVALRPAASLFITAGALAFSGAAGSENLAARVVLSGAMLIWVWILIDALGAQGERAYTLAASVFLIACLILPALIQCASGAFPFYRKSYPEDLVSAAAWMMFAFSAPFGLAYWMSGTQAKALEPPKLSIATGRATMLIAALAVVALIGFAFRPADFLTRRGDLELLLGRSSPIDLTRTAIVRDAGYLAFLLNLCCIKQSGKSPLWVLLPGTLFVALLVNNPFNIPRFPLMALAICTILVMSRTATTRFKLTFVSVYLGGLLTLFPFLSQWARGARGAALLPNIGEYYGRAMDFDGFQSMINIYYWVSEQGVQWGKQALSAALIYVPREVWPAKAYASGTLAAAYAGYSMTNISGPLPGELFADFGWVGVILGGFFCGWLVRRLDRAFALSRGNIGAMASLGLGAGFTAILLRGSLINIIAPVAAALLMGLVLGIANSQRRAPAATPRRSADRARAYQPL